MPKTFTKSTSNKIVMGICGGVAEYFNIDAKLVRVCTAIVCAANPVGSVVVYLIAGLLMDNKKENK